MGRSSRVKGSSAELEVAKLLAAWWQRLEPDCTFCRTPSSGGWGRPEHRAAYRACGDLTTDAKRFAFACEVKRREGWDWVRFKAGRASPVWSWWRQAQAQAEDAGLAPMLWFRKSRQPWRVLVPGDMRVLVEVVWPAGAVTSWDDRALLGLGVGLRPACVDAAALLGHDPLAYARREGAGV